jgi:hypothetical protein
MSLEGWKEGGRKGYGRTFQDVHIFGRSVREFLKPSMARGREGGRGRGVRRERGRKGSVC